MAGFRPAFWPTVITVPAVAILICLGVWQLVRLQWKTELIAEIQTRTEAAAVELPAVIEDPAKWNYRRVTVTGVFDHDKEIHMVSHSYRGNLGYHVYTPVRRDDGGDTVIVNRGWIPSEQKDPSSRAAGQLQGSVTLTGYFRKPWPQGAFVPDNDLQQNVWFFPDLATMTGEMGIPATSYFVELTEQTAHEGYPVGGQTRLQIRNAHLQYALTWFGLAIALVVIYLLWHRRDESK